MPTAKRKAVKRKDVAQPKKKAVKKPDFDDENITSEEETRRSDASSSSDEYDSDGSETGIATIEETADEKRIRMASDYLEKLKQHESDSELEESALAVSEKLQKKAMETSGKFQRRLADQMRDGEWEDKPARVLKGHQLPLTCLAMSEDGRTAFTGSKDCSIVRYDIETGTKLRYPGKRGDEQSKGHHEQVLSVALSSDGKLLASAGRDKVIRVWDTNTNTCVKVFTGHQQSVNTLAFRHGGHTLYSGGDDRLIKVWNLDDMCYVETLIGHTSEVLSVDSMTRENILSGGRDRTMRMWKVVEGTHLVFRGDGSQDSVRMINEETFVTGGDDGSFCLWGVNKKKATHAVHNAHGTGRWVSSAGALRYSDVVASGGSDGVLRMWKTEPNNTRLTPLHDLPIEGFINDIAFPRGGQFIAAAVGQEPKLGRWERIASARNSLVIWNLPSSQ